MSKTGITAVAAKRRDAYIEIQSVEILNSSELPISDQLRHLFNLHWVSFVSDISKNYSTIARCPYIIKKVTYEYKDKKYTDKIPVALKPGTYMYNCYLDDEDEEIHEFKMIGSKTDPVIHQVRSINYSGAVYNDSEHIDSEFGNIVNEWREMKKLKAQVEEIRTAMIYPPLYVEKVTNSTTHNIDYENAKMEEHLTGKFNINGTQIQEDPTLTARDGAVYLPDMHKISAHQHRLNEKLLDIGNTKWFEVLVDRALGLPYSDYYAGTSIFQSRSSSVVDESRRTLSAKLTSVSADLAHAIKVVWKQIYKEDIEVNIPQRSVVDSDMIERMHLSGIIDAETAQKEMLAIAGMRQAKSTGNINFKPKPAGKKARVVRDDDEQDLE